MTSNMNRGRRSRRSKTVLWSRGPIAVAVAMCGILPATSLQAQGQQGRGQEGRRQQRGQEQRGRGPRRSFQRPPPLPVGPDGQLDFSGVNVPYDGRFTFARLMFDPLGGPRGGFGGMDLKWDHDYPRAERHFMRMLHELTTLRPYMEGGNVLAMDDPELFKYPIAYISEPGFWTMTQAEEENLRAYLLKGGFLILDDFAGPQWFNAQRMVERLLPDHRIVPLEASNPVFDSFFHIESLDFDHPYYGVKSQFYGIFEDNDPTSRLMVILNYNNDVGEYWEWSDTDFLPIELSNEAYKLGINYIVYAMTH